MFGIHPGAGAVGIETKENLPGAAGGVDGSVEGTYEQRGAQLLGELRQ